MPPILSRRWRHPCSVRLPVGLWLTFSACNATIAPEQLLLIVVSLSAPSGSRRSRWWGLCAVTGLGSTQDYPVVIGGVGLAAFVVNGRPSVMMTGVATGLSLYCQRAT